MCKTDVENHYILFPGDPLMDTRMMLYSSSTFSHHVMAKCFKTEIKKYSWTQFFRCPSLTLTFSGVTTGTIDVLSRCYAGNSQEISLLVSEIKPFFMYMF